MKTKPKHAGMSPLKTDPSRTAALRSRMDRTLAKQFDRLKTVITEMVDTDDCFGLRENDSRPFAVNSAFGFMSTVDALNAFKKWLMTTIHITLLADGENAWWRKYIVDGFRKGQERVFEDFRRQNPEVTGSRLDFLKQAFSSPVSQERVDVLASRVFTELQGVTDAMAQGIQRELTDGLTQGLNPKQIAKNIAEKVDGIGKYRAKLIAHTEIVRAHAEGQLAELRTMGVSHVGVMVEYTTAVKGACPICKKKNGKRYTLDQAAGLIPQHPLCRCCFRPVLPSDLLPEDVGGRPTTKTPSDTSEALETQPVDLTSALWQKVKGYFVGNVEGEIATWRKIVGVLTGNYDPNQPRDYHGRFGHGLSYNPTQYIASLKHIGNLPGSTGAQLVQDEKGHKYVLKKGTSPDHIRSEFHAEQAYRALGVKVPDSELFETDHGPVKLSRYVGGGKTLDKVAPTELPKVLSKIQKHFAAHVLLANWDVVGMKKDNIMVHPNHEPFHIDTGGALEYRAQGGKKGAQWNGLTGEWKTMRDAMINPSAASVFGGMSVQQLKDSVAHVVSHKNVLMKVLPEKYHAIMEQRLKSLQAHADALHVQQEYGSPPPVSPVHGPLNTPEAVIQAYNSTKPKTMAGFTQDHLKKLAYLNPNGVHNGAFVVPVVGSKMTDKANTDNVEHFKKILPPGTKLTLKYVTMATVIGHGTPVSITSPSPAKVVPPSVVEHDPSQYSPELQKKIASLTPDQQKKLAYLNPKGLLTGKVVLPVVGTTAKDPMNAKHLGDFQSLIPGTVFSSKIVSMKEVNGGVLKLSPSQTVSPSVVVPQTPAGSHPFVELSAAHWDFPAPKPSAVVSSAHYISEPLMKSAKVSGALKTRLKEWSSELSTHEYEAIASWKSSAHGIRKAITTNPPPPPSQETHAKAFHFFNAIKKAVAYEGTVYRGVRDKEGYPYATNLLAHLKAIGLGGVWADTAPHCMSRSPGTAVSFSSGLSQLVMVIKSKTGRIIEHVSSHLDEKEVTGMPGTKYRVVAFHQNYGLGAHLAKNVVELEEI